MGLHNSFTATSVLAIAGQCVFICHCHQPNYYNETQVCCPRMESLKTRMAMCSYMHQSRPKFFASEPHTCGENENLSIYIYICMYIYMYVYMFGTCVFHIYTSCPICAYFHIACYSVHCCSRDKTSKTEKLNSRIATGTWKRCGKGGTINYQDGNRLLAYCVTLLPTGRAQCIKDRAISSWGPEPELGMRDSTE